MNRFAKFAFAGLFVLSTFAFVSVDNADAGGIGCYRTSYRSVNFSPYHASYCSPSFYNASYFAPSYNWCGNYNYRGSYRSNYGGYDCFPGYSYGSYNYGCYVPTCYGQLGW